MAFHVALQANNGQFVCAERGGGAEVVANRDQLGPWETFDLQWGGPWFPEGMPSSVGIPGVYNLAAANGMFVTSESIREEHVVANRTNPSTWESFFIVIDGHEPKEFDTWKEIEEKIVDGASVGFKNCYWQQYLCAERGGGVEVSCNRAVQGPWETFVLRTLD